MSSSVGGDLSRIETGPCKVTYKGEACGHTIDGVKLSIKPMLRERKVDEYGDYVVEMIHTGDNVEIKTTFPEKSMQTIQTVYQWGYLADDNVWGIGKRPGEKGSDKAGPLLIHPLDAGASTADDVQFWKCVVSDSGEVQYGMVTADRVFECTFKPMVDPTKDDGQILGIIGVAAN